MLINVKVVILAFLSSGLDSAPIKIEAGFPKLDIITTLPRHVEVSEGLNGNGSEAEFDRFWKAIDLEDLMKKTTDHCSKKKYVFFSPVPP